MLVLSRKVGERILIGDGIAVTVVRVGPGVALRLGIEAPNDTPVVREEDQKLRGRSVRRRRGTLGRRPVATSRLTPPNRPLHRLPALKAAAILPHQDPPCLSLFLRLSS